MHSTRGKKHPLANPPSDPDGDSSGSGDDSARLRAHTSRRKGRPRTGGRQQGTRSQGKTQLPANLLSSAPTGTDTLPSAPANSLSSTPSDSLPSAPATGNSLPSAPVLSVAGSLTSTAARPGPRRSTRPKPQRSYVVSFPAITDTEDDEDDGIEYDFCRQEGEF